MNEDKTFSPKPEDDGEEEKEIKVECTRYKPFSFDAEEDDQLPPEIMKLFDEKTRIQIEMASVKRKCEQLSNGTNPLSFPTWTQC